MNCRRGLTTTDSHNGEIVSDLADLRACETEAKMTDEERFSLLVSVMGTNTWILKRDPRIPEGTLMSRVMYQESFVWAFHPF